MAKVTNLEEVRAEKAPLCDWCGQPEHKGVWECPRIKQVKFDNEEDTVTVTLWHPSILAGGE